MDTTWFAIDDDGHVAVFDSGEAGAVPVDAYLGEDYHPIEDTVLEAGTPYRYEHDNLIAGPYGQVDAPADPLTATGLPGEVVARMVRFKGRFAECDDLQPAEHWPVEAWGSAWLSSDETTVRCLPGREETYDEEVAELREDLGDDYTFEPAPAPRPRPEPTRPDPVPEAKVQPRPWWKFWTK